MPGFRSTPQPTPAIGGPHPWLAITQQPPEQSRTSNQRARGPQQAPPVGVHRDANQHAASRSRHQCDTGGQPGNRLPFHRCLGRWHRWCSARPSCRVSCNRISHNRALNCKLSGRGRKFSAGPKPTGSSGVYKLGSNVRTAPRLACSWFEWRQGGADGGLGRSPYRFIQCE